MIRWGLVGLGDISNKRVAPAILAQPDSALLAVASPFPEELAAFARKFAVERAYPEYGSMLADPDVDAVYVATPIHLHYPMALQALRAGKHVLVEKPMAMKNEECETLVRESRERGLHLGVAYFRRFFPKMREIRRLIDEGAIGEPVAARIVFHSWYDPAKEDPKHWRVEKAKSGGGPLWDMGCHKFDMLVALLGMPKSVSARMSTQTHSYEVEDSCSAVLELANGGHALAAFHWNSRVWSDEFVILGTRGKIVLDPCDGDTLTLEVPPKALKGMGKEVTTVTLPNAANVHAPLVDDFARALLEGRDPLVTGEEGFRTNRILEGIERSSDEGRRIAL